MPHASESNGPASALARFMDEPVWLPDADIKTCRTYRDACLLAWKRRQVPELTKALLASLAGLHAPHVTNYFHIEATDRHGARRAELPAAAIGRIEKILGNRAISQYLARMGAYQIACNHAESRGDYGAKASIEDCESCGV